MSTNLPASLPEAIQKIESLQGALAEAERVRDAYWKIISKVLPVAPPEFELGDEEFASLLTNAESADEFLDRLFQEKGAA